MNPLACIRTIFHFLIQHRRTSSVLFENNAISGVIPVIVAIRWTSVNMFSYSPLTPANPQEHDDDNDNIIIYHPWFFTRINEIIWGIDRLCLRRNDFIDLSYTYTPYAIKGVFHQAYRVSFIVFEVFCETRVRAMN